MRIRYTLCLWLYVVAMSIFSFMIIIYSETNDTYFTCNSQFTIAYQKNYISIFIKYNFADGKGKYELVGKLVEGDKPVKNIIRTMGFSYFKNNNSLVMISDSDNPNGDNAKLLVPELPDFFIYKGRSMILQIYNRGTSSMLLAQDDTPVLFCKKK